MSNAEVVEVEVAALRCVLSPRREGVDAEHVSALASVFDRLPPIVVHQPTMRVIDGAHRLRAAEHLKRSHIRAAVWDGSDADAEIEAIRLNVAHGKPLSRSDREAAVVRVLALAPEFSDRRVAETCGVAPTTVDAVRRRASVSRPAARVGRDGRVRTADPAGVRLRIAALLASEPTLSNREIARRAHGSEATVRDVRRRQADGEPILPERQRKAPGTFATDAALHSDKELSHFAEWLERSTIDTADWLPFASTVPISRIYEVIDEARRRAESWQSFALELERRSRSIR